MNGDGIVSLAFALGGAACICFPDARHYTVQTADKQNKLCKDPWTAYHCACENCDKGDKTIKPSDSSYRIFLHFILHCRGTQELSQTT